MDKRIQIETFFNRILSRRIDNKKKKKKRNERKVSERFNGLA